MKNNTDIVQPEVIVPSLADLTKFARIVANHAELLWRFAEAIQSLRTHSNWTGNAYYHGQNYRKNAGISKNFWHSAQ